MVVDDAQWADSPSLRFLAHLVSDLDAWPVAVVVAARRGAAADSPVELSQGVIGTPGGHVLRLRPLSLSAVELVVRRVYPDAATEFWQACARSTGGNPFYLHELLELVRAEGIPADNQVDVEALVPESVMRSVLVRLGRLADPAPALAAAAAVLGEGAPLRQAASLAGLDDGSAETAADTLAAAHILQPGDPLVFAHPLIRTAVHADLPALARSRAHRRAAEVVRAEGASVEAVAAHLLVCRAQGDREVVETLCEAAQRATARGGHRAALRLLDRALAEPPAPARRDRVTIALALTQAAVGAPDALARLRDSLDLMDDPGQRVATLRALARVLFARSDFDAAAEAVDRAFSEVASTEDTTSSELIVDSLVITSVGRCPRPVVTTRLAGLLEAAEGGRLPAEAGLAAQLAGAMVAAGRPAEQVSQAARAALAGLPADDGFYGVVTGFAVVALISVDDFEAAEPAIDQALIRAQETGSLIASGTANHWRALLRYRRGDLDGAITDGEQTLEICRAGWDMCVGWVAPILACAYMDRGDLDAAERAVRLGEGLPHDRPEAALTQAARGRLALMRNDPASALDHLREAGAHAEQSGMTQPTMLAWRSWAALAATALDKRADANELAMTELAQARAIGAARTLAVALRAAGTVQAGKGGLDLLDEAVEVLSQSQACLDHARALVALGTALRRAGRNTASQGPLRRGLTLAQSLGAVPLSAYANDELRAAGGRRSPSRRTNPIGLTPTEHRVAQLAAQGLSSPQIAQTLYITPKTVDWHLGHAFRKLGVTSRRHLSAALSGQPRNNNAND